MAHYWWTSWGAPAVIFKAPRRFVSKNGGAAQTGTSADPIAIANFQSALDSAQPGTAFFLSGEEIALSAPISVSVPGVQIVGCGTTEQDAPQSVLFRGLSTWTWTNVSGTIFSSTVSGTIRAVYVADATAKALDALYLPLQLARNTTTPTTPGTNEWGQSGTTLYINIGSNPAGRTIWAVNASGALVSLDPGADDFVLRGVQLGPCAPNGGAFLMSGSATQPDSTQRMAQNVLLEQVWAVGAWDQTSTGAGNGFGIAHPCRVEMLACRALLCDNDGINIKQMASVTADGFISDRTGDEGASPHYGATLILKNSSISNTGWLNTADGYGLAVWQGASLFAENTRVFNPRNSGVYVGGGPEFAPNLAVLENCEVTTGRQETGASYGTNGIEAFGRSKVICRNVRVSGFYSQTAGQGNGFYLNNADAEQRTEMTLDGCAVHGCRINVRATLAGTTAGSRMDVWRIENKTPYHQTFGTGSTRYHEFVSGGSSASNLTINWKSGGTAAVTSSSATTLSETTGLTDWSYF